MEEYYVIWLNDFVNISMKKKYKLLKQMGSAQAIWEADSMELSEKGGLNSEELYKLASARNKEKLDRYVSKVYDIGAKYITYKSPEYPQLLKRTTLPPIGFYVLGTLPEDSLNKVAFVGSRRCTQYGSQCCYKISKELAAKGVVIVSGMAVGIDSMAHKGAIDAGGKTIAVIGTGIDVCYPASNRELREEIIKNGCIISEFPLGTQPYGYNFPQRNRIISGLCEAVAVIEATYKSGSLITANYANEYSRNIFAMPGNITSNLSQGTNKLIKDGALVLTSSEDILDSLHIVAAKEEVSVEKNIQKNIFSLESNEKLVYDGIGSDPITLDELVVKTGLDIRTLEYCLTLLEIKGAVIKHSGERYSKSL